MNFERLNKAITYIEENLENEINYKYIGKIVGVNPFILQRIFMFMTGTTLTDYIKKRRLSRAYEDLKNSEDKIIDIALRYRYTSAASFDRAFKSTFGITPKECRKSKSRIQIIPVYHFDEPHPREYELSYEILDVEDIHLYCFHIESDDLDNLQYKIRKLYSKIQSQKIYEDFTRTGMYGLFRSQNEEYHYFVGSKKENKMFAKTTIKGGKYARFYLPSRKQKDILGLENEIYGRWILSTKYELGSGDNFELYEEDHCYIYVSIK